MLSQVSDREESTKAPLLWRWNQPGQQQGRDSNREAFRGKIQRILADGLSPPNCAAKRPPACTQLHVFQSQELQEAHLRRSPGPHPGLREVDMTGQRTGPFSASCQSLISCHAHLNGSRSGQHASTVCFMGLLCYCKTKKRNWNCNVKCNCQECGACNR